jgi:hypothetical protein
MKRLAMERCEREGIPFTLAMTITPENLPHLWATIETGLRYSCCRGVSFQPMFLTGRRPAAAAKRLAGTTRDSATRHEPMIPCP